MTATVRIATPALLERIEQTESQVAWLVGLLLVSNGCATLAHRNSHSSESEACPWLVGDALLLIPGVVPGVIAFCVDFGTGAWHHDPGQAESSVTTAEYSQ